MTRFGIVAAIIIGTALILAITSFWNDSLVVDEIPHVGSGYSYVKKLDFRLNPEHPPLAKALAAVPLLFLDLKQDAFQTKFWLTDINGQWDFGRFLLFQSGNDANLITRTVKFPILVFFIIAAIQVYCWAQRMYGKFAAFTALTLFAFSPTILAHSRFVTTDIPALLGIVLATSLFLKYLYYPTRKNLWFAGIAFGVAILTKFSTFLLVPYFLVLAVVYGFIHSDKKLKFVIHYSLFVILIFIIGFVLVVWPVYYLFTFSYPPERQGADTEFLLGSFGNRTLAEVNIWMADKPVIRGLGEYMLGLLMVGQRAVGGNTVYFLGEVSSEGWKHYFPVVYALKEPLAWLILLAMSLLYLAWQTKKSSIKTQVLKFLKNQFVEFTMLLWILIYWSSSIYSDLNIGVRHLLPTYPFAIILVSGQLARLRHKIKYFTGIVILLLAWYVTENIKTWPHYLSYFNQLAGGPSGGYRYVVDSNLDWGQDLKRLSQWVEENNVNEIYLDYFGWSDPVYYLGPKFKWLTAEQYKNAEDFIDKTGETLSVPGSPAKRGGGYIGVSATFFMNSRENLDTSYIWLQRHEPVVVIGNSIWVWELR